MLQKLFGNEFNLCIDQKYFQLTNIFNYSSIVVKNLILWRANLIVVKLRSIFSFIYEKLLIFNYNNDFS